MKGDRERCLAAGMDGYLAKPIRSRELVALLGELVPQGRPPVRKKSAAGETLNRETLLAEVDGDRDLLRYLVSVFEDQVEGQSAALREALARGNAEALENAAHALKGSLGPWGQGRAWEAAHALEEAARRNDLAAAETGAAALELEASRT